jgi:polyisoprenoid-binding protein YceI
MVDPRKRLAAFIIAALLSACASQVARQPQAPGARPESFPEQYYVEALDAHRRVFRIDPAASLVVVEAHRAGSLAQLGHDHVIVSHDVRGYVVPEEDRADLYVELARLAVDEPGLRAEAGFTTRPTEDDIAGTRTNMLKGLHAEQYPFALVGIARGSREGRGSPLHVAITLHGTTRTFDAPVQMEEGNGGLRVAGHLAFNQTDFGIVPLSVLGGAIQVRDQLNLRFEIVARLVEH